MRWENTHTQTCSIARSTAIIGDRWTLLIIRQVFLRIRRFSEIQTTLGISKHRLSDRLNRLVDSEIIYREVYDQARNRSEYKLTDSGLELYPVIVALASWGDKWLDDGDGAPVEYVHNSCGCIANPKLCCSNCSEEVTALDTIVTPGPGITKKIDRGDLPAADLELYEKIMSL
ncbi:MAG: DNA-binding HxlR family transcriptional regulator [Arenicella sp.]|jgi:DNA-binding HxlR family transcriptional regulator